MKTHKVRDTLAAQVVTIEVTNAVKGNSNCEKHLDDNEDTTEDDVRNIRGDIVIEKNPFSDFIDVKDCQG